MNRRVVMNQRKTLSCVWIMILCLMASAARAQSPEDLLAEATASVRTAQTPQELAEAALLFESLLSDRENSGLHYNLANLYQRSGQYGLGILHYLKALRLDPGNREVEHNLSLARKMREDHIRPQSPPLLLRLAFWHDSISQRSKFWIAWISFVLFWCLAGFKIWTTKFSAAPFMVASGILFLSFMGSFAIQEYDEANHPMGVVMDEKVIVRTGNGHHYPSAFEDPIHEGAEFQVREIRKVWLKISLGRDQTGWVPRASVALVTESQKNLLITR